MLTSKQRAYLRGRSASLETILQVGKEGVTEAVTAQASQALTARELIKGRVLDAAMLTAREACEALAAACSAEAVCAVGSRFVLYRANRTLPREKRIELP